METEGTHTPVAIHRPAAVPVPKVEKIVCEECSQRPAVYLCLCRFSCRKLCEPCDTLHYQRPPQTAHSKHPVRECQAVLSGKVPIIDFRKKQAYISEFLVQLEQEISDHDDFSRRVEEELTNLAEEFLAQKDAVLNELAIQRPKLIAAVEETKRIIAEKRYLEAFEVTTYLDDCILNGYKYAALEELRMFKGTIRAQEALEKVVQYEISTSLLQEIILDIPVIKGQSMRLFSPIDLKMTCDSRP